VKTRKGQVDDWQQLVPPRKLAALWRGSARFQHEHPQYSDYTKHLGLALVRENQGGSIAWMRLPPAPDSN
jgi:Holliday junction resolvase-like predicted endonuclease